MRWEQGSEATFTADFATAGGGIVDLEAAPTVSIFTPGGLLFTTGSATYVGDGTWSFVWVVPADAELGMWKTTWEGVSTDGFPMDGEEFFEVILPGDVTPSALVQRLRNHVGDRLMPGMVVTDLFFTDDELHTILAKNDSDIDRATIEGWFIKMAQYSELVDHLESGAEQRMRQKFLNAKSIYDTLVKSAGDTDKANTAALGIIGKPINLRQDFHDALGRGLFWGNPSSSTYVRTYPLKRFPAIMGMKSWV